MTITIIIPIYAFDGHKDFMYPETHKTPLQQVDWLNELVNDEKITSKKELVVVTTSPYIAEGLCRITKPIKDGNNFGEKEDVFFSDGMHYLTCEQFFYHFAEAMKVLLNNITPKNTQ